MSEGFVSASGRSPMTPRPPLAEQLDLLPHPEGGRFRETWRSPVSFSPEGYRGPRSAATSIYFLRHPGEESRWHVVRSDELWFWRSGRPPESPDRAAALLHLGPGQQASPHRPCPRAVRPPAPRL